MQEKISHQVKSELLLNLKDIENIKNSNASTKLMDKANTIDKSLDKYNQAYKKALDAPIPNIKVHYNEIVCRAVPFEVRSKGGIILTEGGLTDINMAKKLEFLSDAIRSKQEVLLTGGLVTEDIEPGDEVEINFKRFRGIAETKAGIIATEYELPIYEIDGYKYLIIDKRDIVYSVKKK